MSDVLTFDTNDKFTVTITSQLVANPLIEWDNTWELEAIGPGTQTSLILFQTCAVAFMLNLMYVWAKVVRARVSTYEPDSSPYNPLKFFDVTHNSPGARDSATNRLDLENVLWIERRVVAGHQGKLFLRGCLEEGDVDAPGGVTVLSNPSAFATAVAAAVAESSIEEFLTGGEHPVRVYMVAPSYSIPVDALALRGVTKNKMRRKRKPPTP